MSGRRRGTKQSFASISVSPSHYSSYNQEIQTETQDFWRFSTRSILVILKIKIFCSPDIVDIHKSGKIASLITVRVSVSTKRIDWSPPYTLIFNYFKGTNRFPPISKVQIDFHLFQNVHNDFHPFPKHNTHWFPHISKCTYWFLLFYKVLIDVHHFQMYTLISTLLKSTNWFPPFFRIIPWFPPLSKNHIDFHYFQNVRVDIHHSQKYTLISNN